VYIAWARRNRSALIRVPMYKPGKEAATRIELRSPDPACNLYLCFAAMLGAGLKGIAEGYELAAPIEENIFKMSEAEMATKGISSLPGSLREAIDHLEKSALMREVLGDHLFNALLDNKKAEWDAYRMQITEWEIERYLPIL
jgi:glutamine synthetase